MDFVNILMKKMPHKTIQNTLFQHHTIFSNTEMLWVVFFFFFCIIFFTILFFSIEKFVILRIKYLIPYYCIYRNVTLQNLNSLLRLVVAKWTFTVWFHAKKADYLKKSRGFSANALNSCTIYRK